MEYWLWTQKEDIGPPPRRSSGMVYDSFSKRIILFGGNVGYGADAQKLNDTWEWKENRWTQIADSGPSPRFGHSMVYDSVRNKIVLFGGTDGMGHNFGDTWEFDGSNWAQIDNSGPSPRFESAMAYDSNTERTILFGGSSQSYFRDTWEWTGEKWLQIGGTGPQGPESRNGHSMVYDSSNKVVILFGGFVQGNASSDTWSMNNNNIWIRLLDIGPPRRGHPSMVYADNRAILFGGATGMERYDDTWDWNGRLWVERQNMGPTHRQWHSMAYDSDRQRIVLFGGEVAASPSGTGETRGTQGDTWELKIQTTPD